jgi:uncharacterized protein YacL
VNIDRRTMWINIGIGAGVLFLFFLPLILPYFLATLGYASHWLIWGIDSMFGVHVLGLPPALAWALVGAILGLCLGFWTVAPALGMRKTRTLAAIIPIAFLIVLMALDMNVSLHQPRPAEDPTLDTPAPRRDIQLQLPF